MEGPKYFPAIPQVAQVSMRLTDNWPVRLTSQPSSVALISTSRKLSTCSEAAVRHAATSTFRLLPGLLPATASAPSIQKRVMRNQAHCCAPCQDRLVCDATTNERRSVIRALQQRRHLGKYRHFHAAEMKNGINSFIGVAVIVVNLALGQLFLWPSTQELAVYAWKWTAGLLGLLAAIGTASQTFFGFSRKVEGYRRTANRYLSLARECQYLQTQFNDGLVVLQPYPERLRVLLEQYNAINVEAENFPTGKRQFKAALRLERQRQGWLQREYVPRMP